MQNDGGQQKPKALVCPICGNSYGIRSLKFHYKWDRKKWEAQNAEDDGVIEKGPLLPHSLNYVMNELEEISSEEADIFNNIAYACSLNQPKADPDWLYNNQAKR